MTKKEKEQLKLNNLLQECIQKQKVIGLNPANNIEIYIEKDVVTNSKCPRFSDGCSIVFSDSNRKAILIKRKCFNVYSSEQLKALIHHELIHLNLKNDGTMIQHKKDWKLFTELANKIYKTYGINPLVSIDLSCYNQDNHSFAHNTIAECDKCGAKSYMFLNETKNYNFNKPCPFCGNKLTYKKASRYD